MAALGEILRRFRFHGVPGAPSAAAVPAERTTQLEAELEPVLAALDEAQRAARALVAAAEQQATDHRARAFEEAVAIVADAHAAVVATRNEAAAGVRGRADAERRRVLAEGRAEAARVAAVSEARFDALVERVVTHVLAQVGAHAVPPGPST